MASSRDQQTPHNNDDGFLLCAEILAEVAKLSVGIKAFLDNKSNFNSTEVKQISVVAAQMLQGVKDHLPEFEKNLKELSKQISDQEKKKVDKELKKSQAELISSMKSVYKKVEKSYKDIEDLYKKTHVTYTTLDEKLTKLLNGPSAKMFSSSKKTDATSSNNQKLSR